MNGRWKIIGAVAAVLLIAGASYAFLAAGNRAGTRPMITYSADAYVQESNTLLTSFSSSTGYQTAPAIGGGSYSDARTIGQGAPADVFISVSLGSYAQSYLKSRFSGWALAIASDQLVIAYSNSTLLSPAAKSFISQFQYSLPGNSSAVELSAFTNLTNGKVKIGIANPQDDPAGLRGWLALEIAGYLYAGGNTSYFTDRAVQNNANVSAPSASALVAPLETGNIQFLFIYKSAAVAKGLRYLPLPPALNQGNSSMSSFYGMFTYNLPDGPVSGSPIYLFVTVLANSTEAGAAYAFLDFVVNNTAVLSSFGMTPLSTSVLFSSLPLPIEISRLVSTGRVVQGGIL